MEDFDIDIVLPPQARLGRVGKVDTEGLVNLLSIVANAQSREYSKVSNNWNFKYAVVV